jgi:mannose-6-phosphate isomerase-like protein (cupin superfamily)
VIRARYPDADIVFANGGDRTQANIPEMTVQDDRVTFAFGVGGEDKRNSSSWILQEWKAPRTQRQWGYYRVLHEVGDHTKVKELTVEPGQRLSMQQHQHRAEHWFVAEGTATVYTINKSTDSELQGVYHKHQSLHIGNTQWHQLCNESTEPLKVVEIQYGSQCVEGDIKRK